MEGDRLLEEGKPRRCRCHHGSDWKKLHVQFYVFLVQLRKIRGLWFISAHGGINDIYQMSMTNGTHFSTNQNQIPKLSMILIKYQWQNYSDAIYFSTNQNGNVLITAANGNASVRPFASFLNTYRPSRPDIKPIQKTQKTSAIDDPN